MTSINDRRWSIVHYHSRPREAIRLNRERIHRSLEMFHHQPDPLWNCSHRMNVARMQNTYMRLLSSISRVGAQTSTCTFRRFCRVQPGLLLYPSQLFQQWQILFCTATPPLSSARLDLTGFQVTYGKLLRPFQTHHVEGPCLDSAAQR